MIFTRAGNDAVEMGASRFFICTEPPNPPRWLRRCRKEEQRRFLVRRERASEQGGAARHHSHRDLFIISRAALNFSRSRKKRDGWRLCVCASAFARGTNTQTWHYGAFEAVIVTNSLAARRSPPQLVFREDSSRPAAGETHHFYFSKLLSCVMVLGSD